MISQNLTTIRVIQPRRDQLAADVEAFVAGGGQVQEVPFGVSNSEYATKKGAAARKALKLGRPTEYFGCVEPGCQGEHYAKGRCRNHYKRVWERASRAKKREGR